MKVNNRNNAFTLIELLVVITVIALLVAIIMPALNKAKQSAKRIKCTSNLNQIATAWQMYFMDNNDKFYLKLNAQRTYGGCMGTVYPNEKRPLNKYLNLPVLASNEEAQVFMCPEDDGRKSDIGRRYYYEIGSSYLTNQCMIGNTTVAFPDPDINAAINQNLTKLRATRVYYPQMVLLVGDTHWWTELISASVEGTVWHGRGQHFNMAYMDGHVGHIEIEKGVYNTSTYRMLPFKYKTASELDD